MIENVKDALIELGYSNMSEDSRNFRMKPIYRDSSSNTVLSVRKDTGYFIDFSKNLSGPFEELVKLSLGLKSAEEARAWTETNVNRSSDADESKPRPKVKSPRTLNKESLLKIKHEHDYWTERGVSEEVVKIFEGGVMEEGKMKNRYVFPIFNYKKELIGVSGRYLEEIAEGSPVPKWKHIGDKSQWKYPLYYNYDIIRSSGEVIVVESIGDMLALWDAGIKNAIVTFGIEVNLTLVNLFLKFDVSKITISFNNDSDNNRAGNEASKKAEKKLLKYFDKDQIRVKLPPKNDFGEMDKEEIHEWHQLEYA